MLQQNVFRLWVSVFLIVCGGISGTSCAQYIPVYHAQPEFVKPPEAQVHQISLQDLQPLVPVARQKLLDNIKAWKLELRQYGETADLYNKGVRERNTEARRRLTE